MSELDAEHRDQMAEALYDEGRVWLTPMQQALVVEHLAPLVAGWLADAWDAGWHQAEESWGHEEPTAGNPYRGGDDG